MRARSNVIVAALALALGLGGCGKSNKQKIKEFKEYEGESLPVINAGFAHYRGLGRFLSGFKPEAKDVFLKGVESRLDNFKELIAKIEKIQPKNDELQKFKENDLKLMHAFKNIYKILRDQLRAGKPPQRTAEIIALENEIKERNKKYVEMRKDYAKKYKVTKWKKKKKRWKRKKKKW